MLKYTKVGIDFGCYSLKISAYISKKDGYVNSEYLMKSTMIDDYFEESRGHINEFIKENEIKLASLSISLPGDMEFHTNVGYADLPTDKKNIIQRAMGYEIQESMQISSLSKYEYIWEIISNYKNEDNEINNEIIYNVLSKDIIDELKKITNVRTKIENVLIQPICLKERMERDSVVIDFGHKNTRVYVFESGILKDIEIIKFGGAEISNIVRQVADITNLDNISEIKKNCYMTNSPVSENNDYDENYENDELIGADTDSFSEFNEVKDLLIESIEEAPITESSENNVEGNIENYLIDEETIINCSVAITDELVKVIQKIKQFIRSYELSNEKTFEDFYVLGGVSNLRYLIDVLSSEFSLEVKALKNYKDFKHFNLAKHDNAFLISNVLTDIKKNKMIKSLNFNKFAKYSINIVPILAGILCMTLVINGAAYKINKDYDNKIEELNHTLSVVTSEAQVAQQLTSSILSDIQDVQSLAAASDKIEIQKRWLSDIYKELKKVTPSKLVIYKIDSRSNVLVLNGFSRNYSDIGFLGLALERYGEVTVNKINKSSENKYIKVGGKDLEMKQAFQIVIEYDGELAKDSADINTNKKTPKTLEATEIIKENK